MATDASPDPARAEATLADLSLTHAVVNEGFATEADLRAYRAEYYDREKKGRRRDLQLFFCFFLIVVVGVVVTLKVQGIAQGLRDNDANLAKGLYTACIQRANTAQQYNVGREALVQLAISGPNAPKDPAARATMAKQLRDGLLLPVEDCGPRPN